ncbi:MAG TPA: sugar phosphate isomerase/epimerase family protein [Pyrinomonadaceae bacterium]|nr:sugar phosphate isomerase/epimerase family protein [Pyrinomonadaceae bacterium]
MQVFASTTCLGIGRTDLGEVLPRLADLPIDGVELGSTHVWRADLDQIVTRSGLSRIVTHNYFPPAPEELVINIASADSAIRQASIEHARKCIDFASRCGAELYTIHPGFMAPTAVAPEARSRAVAFDFEFLGDTALHQDSFGLMREALRELLSYARVAGVRLAIETEGSVTRPGMLLMEKPEEYHRLYNEVGDELLLNFNLAHSSLAASVHGFNLVDFINEFSPFFAAVEISHNNGEQDEHLPLVSGSYVFDWTDLLPDVPLILEFREASIEDISASVEMLRSCEASVIS